MNADVAEVVRAVLATAAGSGSEPPSGLDSPLWTQLEDGGFTTLAMAQVRGGGGGTLDEAATVVHEAAYAAAAIPIGETVMLAGPLLDAAGLAAPPGPLSVANGDGITVTDTGILSGTTGPVPWLRWVDTLVLIVGEAPRQSLALVSPADGHVSSGVNLAGEPRDILVLDRVPAMTVPLPEGDWSAWLAERGALLRAVQLAAAATRVRDRTVAYASTRHQFGRPIAAFQAVQHRLVELAAQVTLMRAAVDAALEATSAQADDARLRTAIAKAETSAGAGIVAAAGHQLHGAIGFTLEHDLGAATKRLWSWRDEFGAEGHWREVVTEQVAAHEAGLWNLLTGGGT